MSRNKLSVLLFTSLMLNILTLVGCSENQKYGISTSENVVSIKDNVTQEDKYKIMERLMTSELMCFNEFGKATDLSQDEAVYYCYILEHDESLFKKYNIDINKEIVRLPIILVNELLKKYFNEDDIRSFSSEGTKRRTEVLSINDKEVVIENTGFGGGGRDLELLDIVKDEDDYKFIVNLVIAGPGTVIEPVNSNGLEDGRCEHAGLTDVSCSITMDTVDEKIEKGKKYKIIARDGDIIEKREYRLGKHRDGDYYLKSMKILEKYMK